MSPLRDFVPISELVARVVGRVMRRQRERAAECHPDTCAHICLGLGYCVRLVERPEEERAARAFAEPEVGG